MGLLAGLIGVDEAEVLRLSTHAKHKKKETDRKLKRAIWIRKALGKI